MERVVEDKLGAAAVVGGAGWLMVASGFHPPLPVVDAAGNHAGLGPLDTWTLVHAMESAAFLLLFAGIVALVRSLGTDRRTNTWALAATTTSLLVFIPLTTIDGFVLPLIHDAGASSSAWTSVDALNRNLFAVFVIVFYGITAILLGWTLVQSTSYPTWMGGVSTAFGFLGLLSGGALVAGGIWLPTIFSLASVGFTVLLLVLGVLYWLRANRDITS